MSDIQLHHIFNHLAPIGVMTGYIVLMAGLILKKPHVRLTAAWIILIAGLTALPANKTGEMAEETSENIAGVSHDAIHEHEEAAELALQLTLVSAVLALAFIIGEKKFPQWKNAIMWIMMAATLSAVITLTIASHQGGLIRHPELSGQANPSAPGSTQEEEEHDD